LLFLLLFMLLLLLLLLQLLLVLLIMVLLLLLQLRLGMVTHLGSPHRLLLLLGEPLLPCALRRLLLLPCRRCR
jgi:hypothetical protein